MAQPPVQRMEVDNLGCRRGIAFLFQNVNLTLNPGQLLQIIGRNGTGKTTLLRCFAGLIRADEGSVTIALPGSESALVYVGHDDGLEERLTVRDELGFQKALATESEHRSALNHPFFEWDRPHTTEVRALSRGWRRRLSLQRLRWYAGGLWILDEPFTHLDTHGQALLTDALLFHLRAGGMVALSTHTPLTSPPFHSLQTLRLTRTLQAGEDA